MMLPSHLLGTLLLGALIAWVRPVRPQDWLLALGFGVAIDLDHALQLPAYIFSHGLIGLSPTEMLHWGAAWQGLMHTPWALLVVAPACLLYRSWAPAVFWGLHMVQDFVIARRFVVFGSTTEWAIDAAMLILVGALFWAEHKRHGAGRPIAGHIVARLGFDRLVARFRKAPAAPEA